MLQIMIKNDCKTSSQDNSEENSCWRLQIAQGWRNKTRRGALTLKQTSAFLDLHHIILYTKTQNHLFQLLQQCSHPPKDSQYRSLCSVFIPLSVRAASHVCGGSATAGPQGRFIIKASIVLSVFC